MVTIDRIRARASWAGWMLRYWMLDKYRREIFVAAAAVAATAAIALAVEIVTG